MCTAIPSDEVMCFSMRATSYVSKAYTLSVRRWKNLMSDRHISRRGRSGKEEGRRASRVLAQVERRLARHNVTGAVHGYVWELDMRNFLRGEPYFIFYRDYFEWVEEAETPEKFLERMDAICIYAFKEIDVGIVPRRFKKRIDAERNQRGRRCKEYTEWRRKVYERDNYTCAICGQVGGRLNAHHIKPYAYYPKLRYRTSNGITLCESCHRKVHKSKRL